MGSLLSIVFGVVTLFSTNDRLVAKDDQGRAQYGKPGVRPPKKTKIIHYTMGGVLVTGGLVGMGFVIAEWWKKIEKRTK